MLLILIPNVNSHYITIKLKSFLPHVLLLNESKGDRGKKGF